MISRCGRRRRAAVTVETAVVLPVFLFLLLMLVVGGIGVFRYQQVGMLAREGTRWTSVRGSAWQLDTGQTSPTEQEILQKAVVPMAVGMDVSKITIKAELIDGQTGAATPWDSSRKNPLGVAKSNQGVTNRIRITVNYEWTPGALFSGSVFMSSLSELPMSN
jgi:Flp pilus assembly protein TadG